MTDELAWTYPVTVARLPEDGERFELAPDEAARAALARRAGVSAVPTLVAKLRVRPDHGGGALVEGSLRATVTQSCVVSLEPFDNPIEEEIYLRFAPAEAIDQPTDELVQLSDEDPPEPMVDGMIDLAEVVGEFLTLAIDPYPRKPGTTFTQPQADAPAADASPFAVLEKLKGGAKGGSR